MLREMAMAGRICVARDSVYVIRSVVLLCPSKFDLDFCVFLQLTFDRLRSRKHRNIFIFLI